MIKYGPLLFGLAMLLESIPPKVIIQSNPGQDILKELLLPIAFLGLAVIIYLNAGNKLKYVAIGTSRVIIKKNRQEIEYSWLDVESIALNRFWGLYKLKIKNESEIYFTPYGMVTWLFGDSSDMGVIINKMKKELQI